MATDIAIASLTNLPAGQVANGDIIPIVDISDLTNPGGTTKGATAAALALYANTHSGIFSVKDYGALGDGTTDDTAAIQLTVFTAAAAGGATYFPGGTYVISNTITFVAGNTYSLFGDGEQSIIRPLIPGGSGALSWWFGAGVGLDLHGCLISIDSLVFDGINVPATYTPSNQGTKTPLVLWGASTSSVISEVVIRNCVFRNCMNLYQPADRTTANYWNAGSGGINLQFADKVSLTNNRFDTVWSYPMLLKNCRVANISGNIAETCFNAFIGAAGGTYNITGNTCRNTGTFGCDIGESGEQIQSTDVSITGNSFQSMAWYYGVVRMQGAVNYVLSGNVVDLIALNSSLNSGYAFYTQRHNYDISAVNQTDAILISVKQAPTAPAGVIGNMVISGNSININDVVQHGIYVYLDGVASGQTSGLSITGNMIGYVVATTAQAITRAYIRVQRSTNTFSCFGVSIQGNICTARYAPSLDVTQTNANDRPFMIGGGSSSGSTANLSGVTIAANHINPVAADAGTLTKEFLNIDLYVADIVIGMNNCVVFLHKPLYTPDTTYVSDLNYEEVAFAPTQTLVAASTVLPIAQNIPISAAGNISMSGAVLPTSGQKDGKFVRLTNVSGNNITLTTGGGSNLTLLSTTLVLAPNQSVSLVYDLIFTAWREVGRTVGGAVVATTLTASGAFGVNGATAQTAVASGGAAPAGGTGATAGAYDTSAHRDALITLVNNMRTALVNNGIMS